MEKEVCNVKCIETENGLRIEANGDGVKECFESCCKGKINCCG